MTFFINIFRGFVLSVILEQRQWYWLRAVCGWLWCVFQMKKAKKLIRIFFLCGLLIWVWNDIWSLFKHKYQPNAVAPTWLWTFRYLRKTDACLENGKMFEIPLLDVLTAIWEEQTLFFFLISSTSALPQTPPFIWSFKIHKLWLGDYFYTHCL